MAKQDGDESKRIPPDWGEPGGPFPTFALSDEQWMEIARVIAISPANREARQAFDEAIGKYRRREVNDAARLPAADARHRLRELRRCSLELRNSLSWCVENLDTYFALSLVKLGGEQLHSENYESFEAFITELHELADLAELAIMRVEDGKRGPKTQNVYLLVAELDALFERFTGSLIRRSSYPDFLAKDYIELVSRIANPLIGAGTLASAMRDSIRRRDGRRVP